VITPFKSLLAMASSEDSTIAAKWLFTDGCDERSTIFIALDDDDFGIWSSLFSPCEKECGLWDERSLFTLQLIFGCGCQPFGCFPHRDRQVTGDKVSATKTLVINLATASLNIGGGQACAARCANPAACEFESCCLKLRHNAGPFRHRII
jgi:hypothetical protein